MEDIFTLQTWILILIYGGISTLFVLLISSTLSFFFTHTLGSFGYIFKTLAIGLLAIPIAILLLCLLIRYMLWNKILMPIWRRIKKPVREQIKYDDVDELDQKIMIHLIHGTFEQNAAWTQTGSALRKEIEALELNATITHFSWDGQNTAAARTRAAIALGEKLAHSPARHNYLIAHSHGGAIVREMSHIRDDIAHKISGVCLLSPPFIYRRKIERTSGVLFNLTDISGSFVIQLLLALSLIPFDLYNFYVSVGIFLLTSIAECKIAKYSKRSLNQELKNEKDREFIALNNVQIFQAIGDEADSVLRFVSSLHEGCFAVLSQLKAASDQNTKLARSSMVLSYLIYAGAGTTLWCFFPDLRDVAAVCGVGFILIGVIHLWRHFKPSNNIPNILITAAMPIAIISFWLGVAKALAYGDLRLIFCPEVFVASSETPAGNFKVRKFAPLSDGTLIHSTHSHPEAIKDVAQWLNSSEHDRASKPTRG